MQKRPCPANTTQPVLVYFDETTAGDRYQSRLPSLINHYSPTKGDR